MSWEAATTGRSTWHEWSLPSSRDIARLPKIEAIKDGEDFYWEWGHRALPPSYRQLAQQRFPEAYRAWQQRRLAVCQAICTTSNTAALRDQLKQNYDNILTVMAAAGLS